LDEICLGEDGISQSAVMALCNSPQTVAEARILVHVSYLEIVDPGIRKLSYVAREKGES
jgi:hypothetical protein